jgi:hypothetical protein
MSVNDLIRKSLPIGKQGSEKKVDRCLEWIEASKPSSCQNLVHHLFVWRPIVFYDKNARENHARYGGVYVTQRITQ